MKIQTVLEIPDEDLVDLLTTAVEGGIGYWARAMEYKWDCDPSEAVAVLVVFADAMNDLNIDEWGYQTIDKMYDDQDPALKFYTYRVDIVRLCDTIGAALAGGYGKNGITYANHFLSGDYDATTADVLVQLACFGEIIYG